MIRKMIVLLLAVMAAAGLSAEKVSIGYCAGQIANRGNLSVDGNTWVDAAIYLPADMLSAYSGAKITAINVGIASKLNIDEVDAWIRTSLDGENLRFVSMKLTDSPTFKKGWNEFLLDSEYEITGTEGLYIGMTYHQKGTASALSLVGSPLPNAFFARLGSDAEWAEDTTAGMLSLEAIAEADNVPAYDLALTSATSKLNSSGRYDVTATVVNNGRMGVDGYTVTFGYEGSEPLSKHFDGPLAPKESAEIYCEIPANQTTPILVTIVGLDNGEDAIEANNQVQARVQLVKKVLVEEFTTEECGNCPRVIGWLKNVVEKEEFRNRVEVVCHHAGYYTDFLTLLCDRQMASFFNIGYAPAVMYDRARLSTGAMHESPDNEAAIESAIRRRMEVAPCTGITLAYNFNDDKSQVEVSVELERVKSDSSDPLYLTLYLMEDNVLSQNQSGATGSFRHNHVIRDLNATYGEAVTWVGTKCNYTRTFDIDPEWKVEDLSATAVVALYDSTNTQACAVDNCESIKLHESLDSIVEIESSELGTPVAVELFDLTGRRILSDVAASGVYIVRSTYADGSVRSEKKVK